MYHQVFFLCFIALFPIRIKTGDEKLLEYCDNEIMHLKCLQADEVILIQEGYLGRIRIGKCIEEAMGYFGCKRSVLRELRQICMSKRECQLKVNEIPRSDECFSELRVHLYVRYSCKKIIIKSCEAPLCPNRELKERESAYILHSIACPCSWTLNVPEGRAISLRIFDTSESCTSMSISEESIVFDTNVCPLSNWKLVFTSLTNRLSFALTRKGFTRPILIHFSSLTRSSCSLASISLLSLPATSQVRRLNGTDSTRLIVEGCSKHGQPTSMTCLKGVWKPSTALLFCLARAVGKNYGMSNKVVYFGTFVAASIGGIFIAFILPIILLFLLHRRMSARSPASTTIYDNTKATWCIKPVDYIMEKNYTDC
ncbi:DgyrCDS6053 [Dimorphilus gyrociliatus]|uniref:DgyrCDS6053 n=1 Tax=Dimorphilus gyrociliatus TaxID=2664684 RepID=A0A7I8VLW5_9ANNE|nr:DgyrCDS6053 [Dimorphilus gyrociliatus]